MIDQITEKIFVALDDNYPDEYYNVERYGEAPCGSKSEFDESGGLMFSYRCLTCGAVVGSRGMPGECQLIMNLKE